MKRTMFVAVVLCLAATACKEQPTAVTQTQVTAPPVVTTTALTAPVQLSGLVNLKGVKDFSGVGSNIAVEFTLEDFSFNPTFVKALPSSRVTYRLENLGKAEHTFTIDSLDIDQVIPVAGTVEGQLQLPESGVIQFHCRFHQGQGMQGAFYFEAGAVAAEPTPSPSASGSATGSGTGTKTVKKATARRPTGSGSATTRAANPNDLVIPDIDPGAATTVKAGTTKVASASTTRRVTTTRKTSTTKQPQAPTGAPGKTSPAGNAGTTGAKGNTGGTGAPGATSPPFTGTFPTFN